MLMLMLMLVLMLILIHILILILVICSSLLCFDKICSIMNCTFRAGSFGSFDALTT